MLQITRLEPFDVRTSDRFPDGARVGSDYAKPTAGALAHVPVHVRIDVCAKCI